MKTRKQQVKVLEGTFGKVVQRVGPVMASDSGLRVQAIVEMSDGGALRTAHLHKGEGKWHMALLLTERELQVGEVTYDGR